MYYTGRLGCFPAPFYGPGAYLLFSCRKVRNKVEKVIGSPDELTQTGVGQPIFGEERLAVLFAFELGDLGFYGCADHNHLSVLIFDPLLKGCNVLVAGMDAFFVHICDINDRLNGEQLQVGNGFPVGAIQVEGSYVFAFEQGFAAAGDRGDLFFDLGIATFGGPFEPLDLFFDRVEVPELQFCVDNLLVGHRVDTSVDVDHVVVFKAAHDMHDGVDLANVGQKLVSEAFALACAFNEPGDVYKSDRGRNNPFRLYDVGQDLEAGIRHVNDSHVGFDRAKREVCRLRPVVG